MSSQLHQAVALAQAGQREQARQLLWQHLQDHPDTEVAWLWLASVAADQPEYLRALNEVLRLNPYNQQARRLLDEFQAQHPGVPVSGVPSASVPGAYGVPAAPSAPSYAPPSPAYQPPPAAPVYAPPAAYGGVPDPDYADPRKAKQTPGERIIERERVIEKRRGCLGCGVPGCGCVGCGCWQGCLLAVLLLIVLPVVGCGLLSFSSSTNWIVDWPARYLPGDAGTKELNFETAQYAITLKDAPRSWFLASAQNDDWIKWRDNVLDEALVFTDTTRAWTDFETMGTPVLIDVDMFMMAFTNDAIDIVMDSGVQGDFSCAAVRSQHADAERIYEYDSGLCGYREDRTVPYTSTEKAFKNWEATLPTELWEVTLITPVNEGTALRWTLSVNAQLRTGFMNYEERIDKVAETIKITEK